MSLERFMQDPASQPAAGKAALDVVAGFQSFTKNQRIHHLAGGGP